LNSFFVCRFLTRPGCHLCDLARPEVLAAVEGSGGSVHEIDIDSDDSLLQEFGLRIPVLIGPDDRVLAEGIIDRRGLRRRLRRLHRAGGG
jgi:Glutaredoxin-like domain (DUF836)